MDLLTHRKSEEKKDSQEENQWARHIVEDNLHLFLFTLSLSPCKR